MAAATCCAASVPISSTLAYLPHVKQAGAPVPVQIAACRHDGPQHITHKCCPLRFLHVCTSLETRLPSCFYGIVQIA